MHGESRYQCNREGDMIMRKTMLILALLLVATTQVFGGRISAIEAPSMVYVPPPVLLQPRSGEVNLMGKEFLEFKWSPHEGASGFRDYYDFRIYNGYKTVQETLFFKERIAPDIYQYNIKADKFQDGATYTWAMRQVYTDGRKSPETHTSFKIIKTVAKKAAP
jgi:hypothetical protein